MASATEKYRMTVFRVTSTIRPLGNDLRSAIKQLPVNSRMSDLHRIDVMTHEGSLIEGPGEGYSDAACFTVNEEGPVGT